MALVIRVGDSHPLDRLEEVIVRVTTYAALGFLGLLLILGAVTREAQHFLEALNPTVPAVTGIWMMRRSNPRVLGQMIPSAITIALLTGLADVGAKSGALLGLLSMGIAGALMVRRHAVPFIVTAALGLFGVAYWWNVGGADGRDRLAEAITPALAFAFAAGLVTWLGRTLVAESERRRSATASLVASEEQFRTAFDSSAAVMALVSLGEWRFLRVNEAASRVLGFAEERLLEMALDELLHPEDSATTRARIEGHLEQESHSISSTRYMRGDGTNAHGIMSLAVAADAAGAPSHIVMQLVDTTDQHAAEQRLIDLVASRDELIASVSHELRTPLTAVLGYASLLLESVHEQRPDELELQLREIYNQGHDLVGIIEDLLVFAQSDGESIVLKREFVDVRDQITMVLESLKGEASVSSVRFNGDRSTVYADPLRVRQVIRNLLSNAIRYGGQEVTVEVSEQDGWSSVVVIDDGRGIPEADRERVFEPYQRSEARQGLTASIGVGLTVARRLARLMGGELSYEYRDSRSRFMFTLPMQPDVAVSE